MNQKAGYVKYRAPYTTLPFGLMRLLVEKQVGRNSWPVMAALCNGVHVNRMLDVKSSERIVKLTGLTANQVARGMRELREKGVIVPVTRKTKDGYRHPDRSNFGHVAQYCFTPEAWGWIEGDIEAPED